jgi:hypothetical protein
MHIYVPTGTDGSATTRPMGISLKACQQLGMKEERKKSMSAARHEGTDGSSTTTRPMGLSVLDILVPAS